MIDDTLWTPNHVIGSLAIALAALVAIIIVGVYALAASVLSVFSKP